MPLTDCPSSVSVIPSSGPFKAGDVLTCSSDGYPEPTYQWTDSDGLVVSTDFNVTLTNSSFTFRCTAAGNLTSSCSASAVIRVTGMSHTIEFDKFCYRRVQVNSISYPPRIEND